MLFLASGTIKEAVGSIRFERIGGLAARTPLLSIAFFLGALSRVPSVGFQRGLYARLMRLQHSFPIDMEHTSMDTIRSFLFLLHGH